MRALRRRKLNNTRRVGEKEERQCDLIKAFHGADLQKWLAHSKSRQRKGRRVAKVKRD